MAIYQQEADEVRLTEQPIYGSERVGVYRADQVLSGINHQGGDYSTRQLGKKHYELKDHLGNVRVVVSDRKLLEDRNQDGEAEVRAEVLASYNYYPFGMQQPGRTYEGSAEYRFGFNGKERND